MFVSKLIGAARISYRGLASRCLELRFLWWERLLLSRLEVAGGVNLQVPLRVDGAGSLFIGRGNSFGYRAAPRDGDGGILLQPRERGAVIRIGDGNWFSNNTSVVASERIEIGAHCQIGDHVAIYDSDFHEIAPATRTRSAGPSAPVIIGNNVWLGSRVIVLKGVTIGDNSIVGAMGLVTRSIPPNSIAAGVPAKVIRTIEQ
jgi:maltose O-acetyltransferase